MIGFSHPKTQLFVGDLGDHAFLQRYLLLEEVYRAEVQKMLLN